MKCLSKMLGLKEDIVAAMPRPHDLGMSADLRSNSDRPTGNYVRILGGIFCGRDH